MKTHCESCGSTDVEDLTTGDQGYTACCNELTCDGDVARLPFAVEVSGRIVPVKACCWATIGPMFDDIGGGHKDCSGCEIHPPTRW